MRHCSAVCLFNYNVFSQQSWKKTKDVTTAPSSALYSDYMFPWFHMSCHEAHYILSLWSIPLRLRQLDIEFMKRLSHSVNIIPIIAKADTMTIEERQEFKQRVSLLKVPCTVGLPACLVFTLSDALQPLGYKTTSKCCNALLLNRRLCWSSDLISVSLWFVL